MKDQVERNQACAGKYIEPVLPFGLYRHVFAVIEQLPGHCAVCRSWDKARICRQCQAHFAAPRLRCQRCALPLAGDASVCGQCLRSTPAFDATITAGDYGFPWAGLLARFKFNQALDLSAALALLLSNALSLADAAPVHLVLPVPLSRHRLRERGFNQAWEIARRVAPLQRTRADASVLLRVRDTAHQLTLPRAVRAANMLDAFMVEPDRLAMLHGRDVALVDDVMTTGSTAAECARTLKLAGARSVQVWVVARTPPPDDL